MDAISTYEELLSGKRKRLPSGFWAKESGGFDRLRLLLQYVVMEKRKWTRDDLIVHMTNMDDFLKDIRLKAGIVMLFNGNGHEAFIHSFPDWELNHWELGGKAGSNIWTKEMQIKAITWFMEVRCKGDPVLIEEHLTYKGIKEAGLETIISFHRFNVQEMMQALFPDRDFRFTLDRKRRDRIRGERNPFTTLTDDIVREMKVRRRDEKLTAKQLAHAYGTTLPQAERIVANRTWKHIVV